MASIKIPPDPAIKKIFSTKTEPTNEPKTTPGKNVAIGNKEALSACVQTNLFLVKFFKYANLACIEFNSLFNSYLIYLT